MSWNTVLTFIEGHTPRQTQVSLPGFLKTGKNVSFEEATSLWSQGLALSALDGWTIICHSANLVMFDNDVLAQISGAGRALTLILSGTASVYGFQLHLHGKQVREQIVTEGEIIQENGGPITEELALNALDHDEDWIFSLMEAVTGLRLDDLLALTFEVWSEAA